LANANSAADASAAAAVAAVLAWPDVLLLLLMHWLCMAHAIKLCQSENNHQRQDMHVSVASPRWCWQRQQFD
jgi:hypothetical protein